MQASFTQTRIVSIADRLSVIVIDSPLGILFEAMPIAYQFVIGSRLVRSYRMGTRYIQVTRLGILVTDKLYNWKPG
jgi:hypothetical protein